jgi:hypothetical protein
MTLEMMRSGGRRWLAVAVVAAAALGACRHGTELEEKKGETRCPESRNLMCIAGKDCSMDRERGCERCECSKVDGPTPTDNRIPTGMQPSDRFGR